MTLPEFVLSESQLALSVAVQEIDRLELDFTVIEADVELVPRSTCSGAASSHDALPAASKVESISTGEELQAAAIAAHTKTTMAARRARLMDDFT